MCFLEWRILLCWCHPLGSERCRIEASSMNFMIIMMMMMLTIKTTTIFTTATKTTRTKTNRTKTNRTKTTKKEGQNKEENRFFLLAQKFANFNRLSGLLYEGFKKNMPDHCIDLPEPFAFPILQPFRSFNLPEYLNC